MDYFDGVEDILTEHGYHPEFLQLPLLTPLITEHCLGKSKYRIWWTLELLGKFNIIAHSQGGLDARYLATVLGESHRIASITTISTPHHGTVVSDAYTGIVEVSSSGKEVLLTKSYPLVRIVCVEGENFTAQLEQMTTSYDV